LTREINRIQAVVNTRDEASKRVLEKSGFKKEGKLRKALWDARGELADAYIYSILKVEWKEPKVLKKH
jgi:RimJ/RimL family protein N-acetyltransferase